MTDVYDIDIEYLGKMIPRIGILLPSASSIYIFLTQGYNLFYFWLSVICLFSLALEVNFFKKFIPYLSVNLKPKPIERQYRAKLAVLTKEPFFFLVKGFSIIIWIITATVMCNITKDLVLWLMSFGYILFVLYFAGTIITYIHVGTRQLPRKKVIK